MASFIEFGEDIVITIPKTLENDDITRYEINIQIRDVCWYLYRRYSEFLSLHEFLSSEHGVTKDLLPPKRILNKDPSFIEKRRAGLENYLRTVVHYLQKNMPRKLVLFLNLEKYDVSFLTQDLSIYCFKNGEERLAKSKSGDLSPLELYAITWRLKQPCPVLEIMDQTQNFSHVLDFCSQLEHVFIKGSKTPQYRFSNINLNTLEYELGVFRNIQVITFSEANLESIKDLGNLRERLKILNIHNCSLNNLSQILLCDTVHHVTVEIDKSYQWTALVELHVVHNNLTIIDESIKLLPNLKLLNLENNKLTDIQHVESLEQLEHLNLSLNQFETISDLSSQIKNIRYLNLSQNKISSLVGFENLKCLNTLNLLSNLVADLTEIKYLTQLPCMENLILTGNPLSVIVDYRIKVLEKFDGRAHDVCLDNEKSTQKELDKIAVLQAIRISKLKRISVS